MANNPAAPTLSVRAFAEMMDLPAYEQWDRLEGQKYPGKASAVFRVPYYRRALAAIREFYRSGNQTQSLARAISTIRQSSMTPAQQRNNIRVIGAFQQSVQPTRQLTLQLFGTLRANFNGVVLRYTPDLVAMSGKTQPHILYNCRQVPIEPDVARRTLELIQWVLSSNRVDLSNVGLEYVDLSFRTITHTIRGIRARTLTQARRNAQIIVRLWQGI